MEDFLEDILLNSHDIPHYRIILPAILLHFVVFIYHVNQLCLRFWPTGSRNKTGFTDEQDQDPNSSKGCFNNLVVDISAPNANESFKVWYD